MFRGPYALSPGAGLAESLEEKSQVFWGYGKV